MFGHHKYLPHLHKKLKKPNLPSVYMSKTCEWVANNGEPDQMPRSVASDLVLHCLLRLVCPNTYDK